MFISVGFYSPLHSVFYYQIMIEFPPFLRREVLNLFSSASKSFKTTFNMGDELLLDCDYSSLVRILLLDDFVDTPNLRVPANYFLCYG